MTTDPDDMDDLLDAVADGTPVDWESIGRRGPGRENQRNIRSLRHISRIVSFNLERQRETEPSGSPPGERWGDLVVLERIGAGAHAEVYRAWDTTLQRDVALKLMHAEAGSVEGESPLLAEGRAAARVRHPHVVTVYGVSSHSGRIGLWMELIGGPTLEQRVRSRGPLDFAEVVRLGREISSALSAVHESGVLHRDVKPANIMNDAHGRFVLSDFGIGGRVELDAGDPRALGTPMYAAPECLAGSPATERSDVYSLGMVLRFALSGRHPYDARTMSELRERIRSGSPEALRSLRSDVPAPLESVVSRAMAARPEDRFPTAEHLVESLTSLPQSSTAGGPVAARAHRWRLLAIAGAVLIALAAAILLLPRRPRQEQAAPPAVVLPQPAADAYDVEASIERRSGGSTERLLSGDRVRPGERLSLRIRTTRPAWVYVLNEDDHGERYLLFPQPLYDQRNPLPAETTHGLPGAIDGEESAWAVSSRGGHERFLVVVSPTPVQELENELGKLPAIRQNGAIRYAPVPDRSVERLRGTGVVVPVAPRNHSARASAFDPFRALADREVGVRGIWVRQIVLENP